MSLEFSQGKGNRETYVKISNLEQLTRRAIRQGWFKLGKDLKQTASKEILRRPKAGRTYIIRSPSGRKRRHVASAPGETHANLSGTLRRSLGWIVAGSRTLEWGYGVTSDAPDYAEYLEFGTGRAAARPSLQNAMAVVHRNGETYFNMAFNDVMR